MLARLERDEEGLSERILEHATARPEPAEPVMTASADPVLQPGLFDALEQADPELLRELQAADLNAMPPIEAWQLLQRVQSALKSG